MVKMEEQTEKQIRRRYVSTGGEDPRRRRSGFLPGLLVGFLVAVIAIGIFFALRGGSGAASPIASSSGSGGAVDAQAVNKLKLLEQYIDYYYYKSDEVSKEDMQNGMFKQRGRQGDERPGAGGSRLLYQGRRGHQGPYHDLPERRAHRDGAHKSQSDVPYC